jgi:RNA polymerase sigma factor (sigma-70 family)
VTSEVNEVRLRSLTPSVLGILVRRGADFAAAEDAVQDALVEAVRVWPADPPRDPKGWLVTVAWRRFLDATRADAARRRREDLVDEEPAPGSAPAVGDTLLLYLLCAHPSLTPSSAVALTLRAVGGLTTRQIAQAYLVPEATMAQRISRAKRTVSGVRFDQPGDVATVLRVLQRRAAEFLLCLGQQRVQQADALRRVVRQRAVPPDSSWLEPVARLMSDPVCPLDQPMTCEQHQLMVLLTHALRAA